MTPFVSYLFARSSAAAPEVTPLAQVRPGDRPPAQVTVLLARNGLFARVASPAVQAILPLATIRDGAVRGLASCEPALLQPLGSAPPSATPLPWLAYGVARGTGRLLPITLGYGRRAEAGWPLTYIVAANGVFTSHVTPLYEAVVRVRPFPERIGAHLGLEPLTEGVTLAVPRIPASLLHVCAVEAARIARESGWEALWDVRWDAGSGWSIVQPQQEASPSHVTAAPVSDPGFLLTLHSHGRHRAYWSATDDRDEQRCGLNAVIGDLGDGLRSARLRVRVSVFGYRLDLPAATVFEGLLPIADGLEGGRTAAASLVAPLVGGAVTAGAARDRDGAEALALDTAAPGPSEPLAGPGGDQGAGVGWIGQSSEPGLGAAPMYGATGALQDIGALSANGDGPAPCLRSTIPSERRKRSGLAGFLGWLRRAER